MTHTHTHIIYNDTEPKRPFFGRPGSYHEQPATKHYLNHYGNFVLLSFIAGRSEDFRERYQANKEIMIAKRKMKFWYRHANFSLKEAMEGIAEVKRIWHDSDMPEETFDPAKFMKE
jgi:hypothetical protein